MHNGLLRWDSRHYGTGRAQWLRRRQRASTPSTEPPAACLSNIPAGDFAIKQPGCWLAVHCWLWLLQASLCCQKACEAVNLDCMQSAWLHVMPAYLPVGVQQLGMRDVLTLGSEVCKLTLDKCVAAYMAPNSADSCCMCLCSGIAHPADLAMPGMSKLPVHCLVAHHTGMTT